MDKELCQHANLTNAAASSGPERSRLIGTVPMSRVSFVLTSGGLKADEETLGDPPVRPADSSGDV
jgi:hypothetical protein